MKKFWYQIGCIICVCVALSVLPAQGADVFVMTNVPVSAVGTSAIDARTKAITKGEMQAFTELLDKIVSPKDRNKVQINGHETVSPFVFDWSVANERAGSTRYFGALTVRFKAEPVRSFLEAQQISFLSRLPQPALVLPVFKEGTQMMVLDSLNPLWTAMRENMPASRLFQFKLPVGESDEPALASAVVRGDDNAFRQLAQKYNVTQIMIMEVTKQDTLFNMNTRFLPKHSAPEAEIALQLSDDRTSLSKVCVDLLRDAVRSMSKKWLYLSQNSAQPIEVYPVSAPVEKISDLSRIRQKLQQLNFADKVDIKGYADKQLRVDFHYRGTITELGEKLRLNNLILTAVADKGGQVEYRLVEPEMASELSETQASSVSAEML